jgi:hypothetical protein
MTDRRVAQVVTELKKAGLGRDKIRIDIIEDTIRALDRRSNPESFPLPWPPFAQSEDDKDIAARYAKGFAKLEGLFDKLKKRPRLDAQHEWAVLERATYGDQEKFYDWLDQLKHWRKHLEAFAAGKRSEGLFSDESKKFASKAFKHAAALAAEEIVAGHRLPLKVTKKSSTHGSVFVEIATILANGENATYECRLLKERRTEEAKTRAKRAAKRAQRKKREIGVAK